MPTDDRKESLSELLVVDREEKYLYQTVKLDMSLIAAEAHRHRADADVKIAESQARAAEATHAIPAREETKREITKVVFFGGSMIAIVCVAAFSLVDGALAGVLTACAVAIGGVWAVKEFKKPRALPPSSPASD